MQNGLIMVLADLVESRDKCTGDHIKKTAEYARVIMEQLKKDGVYSEELSDEYIEDVVRSAPLHDIGKIQIPDAILNKTSGLTSEEFEIIKSHTIAGKNIITSAIDMVSEETSGYLNEAKNLAYCHHEKWDGNGYPQKLSGEDIPLSARIMAVADVFDATVIEIYDLVIEETSCGAPEPVNFYLVGSMTDWKVVADEAHTFVANEANPGEYMLPATLAEGDQIKVVGVQGEKQTWYPEDYDGAYTVDAAHAGLVTIYFRPEGGVEGWHYGFFYVSEPTGIEEILSEGKAVKVLREGNILIMKGNHTYTVMGQIVK